MFWISLVSAVAAITCVIVGFGESNIDRGDVDFMLGVPFIVVASLAGPGDGTPPYSVLDADRNAGRLDDLEAA